MLKITKFGGSSCASAEQFRKVKAIIEADPSRRFVVISAAGRKNPKDNKITDLLYLCRAHVDYHVDYRPIFEIIRGRFLEIKHELGLNTPIEDELDAFAEKVPDLSVDELVSRGEYFTSPSSTRSTSWRWSSTAPSISIRPLRISRRCSKSTTAS